MARVPQFNGPLRRSVASDPVAPSADLGAFRAPGIVRRSRPPRTLAAAPASAVRHRPWQFACLVEMTNFAGLRRLLGRARGDTLVLHLEDCIRRVIPEMVTIVVDRTTIEFTCESDTLVELRAVAARVATACRAPFVLDGEPYRLDVAIGAAVAPLGLTEDVRMIEEAESALDAARGDNSVVLRDLSQGAPTFDRLALTRELPVAIARGEMFLQYQPKVHVRRRAIDSAEALVRWQHPTRGLILPGDFITIAEDARQIGALTLWTLDQVIADQALLAADGRDLRIFINISGQLLSDGDFVEAACARVRDGGVKIGFEITETAVIRDPQSAIGNLQIFADEGIVIAIDDYGAGLSSLAYLKQLPARELKIDKMFVLHLTSSHRDPLIVRSTIDLAHALDMEVTAEGVETQAAMALLSVMGCDMVQGYLISRPVSIEAFRQFLRDDPLVTIDQARQPMFRPPAEFWKRA